MHFNLTCAFLLFLSYSASGLHHEEETKNPNHVNLEGIIVQILESVKSFVKCSCATSGMSDETNIAPENGRSCQLEEIAKRELNLPKNCYDLLRRGNSNESGIQTIYPYKKYPSWGIEVVCEQRIEDGGWTIIQSRQDLPRRENFYRTWLEYSLGFGNLSGEFWLGLENIHALTNSILMELRVDLEDENGVKKFAKYDLFSVGSSEEKFALSLGDYAGDAGDSLEKHNKMKFSTHDSDNDIFDANCAQNYRGAWWYKKCHDSNLNAYQYVGSHATHADGINWKSFRGHANSMRKASMMVRPRFRL